MLPLSLFPGQFVEPSDTAEAKSQGVLLLSSKAVGSCLNNCSKELSDEDVSTIVRELEKINRG